MKNYLIHLLNYELWANQRVIAALETLENPPERAVTLMSHVLSAQQVWFSRFTPETAHFGIWEDMPVSWMRETAERQHRQAVSYLTILAEPKLLQSVDYVNSKGVAYQNTLIDILTHLSHHAAYHRGQVVQLIRPLLTEAPVTDFIVWVREA